MLSDRRLKAPGPADGREADLAIALPVSDSAILRERAVPEVIEGQLPGGHRKPIHLR